MKNNYSIHVPVPCHENWDAMTPVEQGRFCQSCAKQVVDFSMMTDQDVLNYFSKATGNTCGRFNNDQLQRPLQPTKIEKKKTWWVAAMIPLMLMFEKVGAQKKNTRSTKPAINVQDLIIKGDTIVTSKRKIHCNVINAKSSPIPFASVSVNGTLQGVTADSAGKFELLLNRDLYSAQIEVSSVGYGSENFFINDSDEYTIVLKEAESKLPSVEVVSYGTTKRKYVTVGAYSICRTTYSIKDTLTKLISPAFDVFPNHAPRGSLVNTRIKTKGSYTILMFDNNGKLISLATFSATKDSTQTTISIPQTVAAGMYYINLVDEQKKKRYAEKFIVM